MWQAPQGARKSAMGSCGYRSPGRKQQRTRVVLPVFVRLAMPDRCALPARFSAASAGLLRAGTGANGSAKKDISFDWIELGK